MSKALSASIVVLALAGVAQAQSFIPITDLTADPISRERASAASGARNADGDYFEAAVLGGDTSGLFYLDDFPDDFIYGPGAQDNGDHLITGVTTSLEIFETSLGGTTFEICVLATTDDGSPWCPAGVDELYLDLGTGFSTAPDGIDFTKPITVKESSVFLLIDGVVVAGAPLIFEPEPAGPLTGLGGFGGVGGTAVNGIMLCWIVNVIPAPGSAALLGLVGLVAVRRRRA